MFHTSEGGQHLLRAPTSAVNQSRAAFALHADGDAARSARMPQSSVHRGDVRKARHVTQHNPAALANCKVPADGVTIRSPHSTAPDTAIEPSLDENMAVTDILAYLCQHLPPASGAVMGDHMPSNRVNMFSWRENVFMERLLRDSAHTFLPRPDHIEPGSKAIFRESPKIRRHATKNSRLDKWVNSGGKRGSTLWPLDKPRIRCKYGKVVSRSGRPDVTCHALLATSAPEPLFGWRQYSLTMEHPLDIYATSPEPDSRSKRRAQVPRVHARGGG